MIRPDDPVGDAREARGEDRWQAGDVVHIQDVGQWCVAELYSLGRNTYGERHWLCICWGKREAWWIDEGGIEHRVYKADASGQQASDQPATGRWE